MNDSYALGGAGVRSGAGRRLDTVVPAEPGFSIATGYPFSVRSSRMFEWLLLQIYSCFNLTPSAQRNTFI